MTLEELKEEARKQGYCLQKLPKYIPLKRCPVCNHKPIKYNSLATNKPKYVCDCGTDTGWCKSINAAREKWNQMMEEKYVV